MKVILAVVVLLSCACAMEIERVKDQGWEVWKQFHKKSYSDLGAERVRYTIWLDNLKRIEAHNAAGQHTYTLGMNHFGDMTHEEFRFNMNGYHGSMRNETRRHGATFLTPANVQPPKAIDWRDNGAVTEVKNQGHCGSCWSFSTTGSLEGQMFRKTGKLVSLSEQNLVDCSTKYGNHGCNGGLMDDAFKYIEDFGIDSEASYPYTAAEHACAFNKSNVAGEVTGWVDVESESEDDLLMAVGTEGPVSVAIDASHYTFQFYKEGVYNETSCSQVNLDHGVLVTGYGQYHHMGGALHDFWWVKNSWGPTWGLQGFIRMSRNEGNQCGIATAASYPLV